MLTEDRSFVQMFKHNVAVFLSELRREFVDILGTEQDPAFTLENDVEVLIHLVLCYYLVAFSILFLNE